MKFVWALLLSLGLFLPGGALGLTAEIEAGVELPVTMIGAKLRFNFSDHLFGLGGLGFTPTSFAQLIGDEAYALGRINKEESSMVGAALSESLYLEARVGYDFTRTGGLYITGGYSLFFNGGGDVSGLDVETALGKNLSTITTNQNVHVEANLHNLNVHLGYSWFFDQFACYLEGGMIKPLFATSKSVLSDSVNATVFDEEAQVNEALDSILSGDLWIFTAGFWVSYNF